MSEAKAALRAQLENLLPLPQVQAFMRLIRKGEGTLGPDGYRTMFGGSKFTSFADHPRKAITARLGKGGSITSTAAGAPQFLSRTWDECAKALDLPDFSPHSQDLGCVFLIRRRGALADVVNGRIREAIEKCNREWASLPGSPYGQPTQDLGPALAYYAEVEKELRGEAQVVTPEVATPATPATPAPQETEMAPLLIPLAASLVQAFTPLAKEKLEKAFSKASGDPKVVEQLAGGVLEAAKQATGLSDPLQAVAAAQADPVLLERAEKLSLDTLERLVPLVERMHALDAASVREAREFNTHEPLMVNFKWLKLRFIHVLSLTFVSFAAWFVVQTWETLTPELRGAVITLMVIAGWNGVRDYWMGSSDGSSRKTDQLVETARKL